MENVKPTTEIMKERYQKIRQNVINAATKVNRNPDNIKIIAVSKTHPVEYITDAMKSGINIFGENYAQEIKSKYEYFEENNLEPPEWHYIGHLQRNKVKYVIPFVNMIHGVDSIRLLRQIDKESEKVERKVDILMQVNTSGEESKFGCEPTELPKLTEEAIKLNNIYLKGLMTIGSFTFDGIINKKEFGMLRELKEKTNEMFNLNLKELSMGMTNDYELAIQEGSTMVRIGTAIFGERNYGK